MDPKKQKILIAVLAVAALGAGYVFYFRDSEAPRSATKGGGPVVRQVKERPEKEVKKERKAKDPQKEEAKQAPAERQQRDEVEVQKAERQKKKESGPTKKKTAKMAPAA